MQYLKVAKISDFSSKRYIVFTYLTRAIAVIKNSDDSFYAIEATCKHQNANLLVNGMQGDIAVCPRHGWTYNMRTGECLTEAWGKLRKYPMKVEDGIIYVLPQAIEEEVQ